MGHPPLLLLHGALETSAQFDALVARLCDRFEVHRFTFLGHGKKFSDQPFSIDDLVSQTQAYIEEHQLDRPFVFGYSMGGYVALALAKQHSGSINKLATLGTILNWTPEKAASEAKMLDPNTIQQKVPSFAKHLDEQHGSDWPALLQRTEEMLTDLGQNPTLAKNDWKQLQLPIRLHVGDRDQSAGLSDTFKVYQQLPQAQLSVLPATPHPFHKVNSDLLIDSLTEFYTT